MESIKGQSRKKTNTEHGDNFAMDLSKASVRDLNQYLHHKIPKDSTQHITITNPDGAHNIAVGMNAPAHVNVKGNVGYYAAGMNQLAEITIHGNAGTGVAENMMSGTVRVKGFASASAGATGHGGTLIIEGDASLRCGISMKGIDIIVGGDVGSYSAFMAQAGNMLICGNAGDALGDSLYEAVIYLRGKVRSLGADAQEQKMTQNDLNKVTELLKRAGFDYNPKDFKRIASAKKLYHWNADANQEY